MKLQKLLSLSRKAIDDFNMIEAGDKIAVGISGGKDSLALLYALAELRRFYPHKFEIIAITIDLGFNNFDTSHIAELCSKLNVIYYVCHTDIYSIVFNERKETNPCSLCSKMRKGALNDAIKKYGCNKVAYAHHKDDVIETLLMSMIFEGRLHTFSPVTYLDRTQITLIRPLIYVNENDIIGFRNMYKLPVIQKLCPNDGFSKREYIKKLIKKIDIDEPGVKQKLFTSVINSGIKGWHRKENMRS